MVTKLKYLTSDTLNKLFVVLIVLVIGGLAELSSPAAVQAQGLIDGFMRGAGNADATFSATFESGDEFWRGETKSDVPPFYNKISRTSLSLYIAYGITDNLDVNLNLPYIFARGDASGPASEIPPQDFNNIQDGQLTLKWRPFHTEAGPGTLNFLVAGALAVPLSHYQNGAFPDQESQKLILSAIGDRTTRVTGALLAQYKFNSGVFTSIQGGYSLKGKTNGGNLDVPNAGLVSGKLGYAGSHIYGAVWIAGQFSADGTDIGEGPFPTNQKDFTKLGITGSVPVIPTLSINAGFATTLDGRNVTDLNAFSVGVTYKL